MAQPFLPEHPREREQLQSSVSAPDFTLAPTYEERPPRRLGAIDLLIALAVVTLLVLAASRWAAPLTPVVQIVTSIPTSAFFLVLLPVLVALPGGLSLAAVVLMLLGTQVYILFNVIAGAMAVPTDLKEATTIYHVTRLRRWRTLIQPVVIPYLVTGLPTASGGAWNASIVSEFVQLNGRTVNTVELGAAIAGAANAGKFSVLLPSADIR